MEKAETQEAGLLPDLPVEEDHRYLSKPAAKLTLASHTHLRYFAFDHSPL
jgi:hypothetical protein